MKKKIIISIIILISLLALAATVAAVFMSSIPKGRYLQNEEYIDNVYNNSYLSQGNLARIDDKLYFNYYGNDSIFMYGLYEISGKTSNRIHWGGPSFDPGSNLCELQVRGSDLLFSGYMDEIKPLAVSGSKLLPQIDGNIFSMNLQSNKINKLYSIKIDGNSFYGYYHIINNKIYIFTDDKIYISDDGVTVAEIFDGLSNVINKSAYEKLCYIKSDILLYVDNNNYLIKYDLKNQRQISVVNLSELNAEPDAYGEVFDCNGKTIITTYKNDCVSVYIVDAETELLYKKQSVDSYYINSYDDKVFISSKSIGLDVIDCNTGKLNSLIKSDVRDTYIVGDSWIYYVDTNGDLNRVPQSGGKFETIFY